MQKPIPCLSNCPISNKILAVIFLICIYSTFDDSIPLFALEGAIPNAGQMLKVPSVWPKAYFRVLTCERLADNRLWLQVQLVNPADAQSVLVVSGEGAAIPEYAIDKSGHPTIAGYRLPAYAVSAAVVTDNLTGKVLPPAARENGDPYIGLDCTNHPLGKDRSFVFGALFQAPNSSDKVFPTISIALQKASQPLKSVPVANQEDLNIIAPDGTVKTTLDQK